MSRHIFFNAIILVVNIENETPVNMLKYVIKFMYISVENKSFHVVNCVTGYLISVIFYESEYLSTLSKTRGLLYSAA